MKEKLIAHTITYIRFDKCYKKKMWTIRNDSDKGIHVRSGRQREEVHLMRFPSLVGGTIEDLFLDV